MKLSQLEKLLERGRELQEDLRLADATLAAFEATEGDTVRATAFAGAVDGLFGRRQFNVDLLPVPKEVAISAARRQRAKIVAQLAELGVELDEKGD